MELVDFGILVASIFVFLVPALLLLRLVVKQFKHEEQMSKVHAEEEEGTKRV